MEHKPSDCVCGFPSGDNAANCERCQLIGRIDALQKTITDVRTAIEKIVCTDEIDGGVIMLSSESPSHFDADRNGWVYDHEHFSPLGDAMVSLWKMTELVPSA